VAIVEVQHKPPHLKVAFDGPQEVLSWAIVGGGRCQANSVVWREVCNADLPTDLDPRAWYREHLHAVFGQEAMVGLLTSRRLHAYQDIGKSADGLAVRCVATVGLGNAVRAGDMAGMDRAVGTINILCWVSCPLSEEAMLEALALASEAKALGIREAEVPSIVSAAPASGTGTDCIVLASPSASKEASPRIYAGKHTVVGHLVGAAVFEAVRRGSLDWKAEQVAMRTAQATK